MNIAEERESAMLPLDIETMRQGRLRALDEVERLRAVLEAITKCVHRECADELARVDALAMKALAE